MWRGPLAYGHATATRIFREVFVVDSGSLTEANDMESSSEIPARSHGTEGSCEQPCDRQRHPRDGPARPPDGPRHRPRIGAARAGGDGTTERVGRAGGRRL